MSDGRLSSQLVAWAARLTYRQLDHLASSGLLGEELAAPGTGAPQRWSLEEAIRVTQLTALRRCGLDWRVAEAVLDGAGPPDPR